MVCEKIWSFSISSWRRRQCPHVLEFVAFIEWFVLIKCTTIPVHFGHIFKIYHLYNDNNSVEGRLWMNNWLSDFKGRAIFGRIIHFSHNPTFCRKTSNFCGFARFARLWVFFFGVATGSSDKFTAWAFLEAREVVFSGPWVAMGARTGLITGWARFFSDIPMLEDFFVLEVSLLLGCLFDQDASTTCW